MLGGSVIAIRMKIPTTFAKTGPFNRYSNMGKVNSDAILKPGAVLKVKKIDFTDLVVMELIETARREQRKVMAYRNVSDRVLRMRITDFSRIRL